MADAGDAVSNGNNNYVNDNAGTVNAESNGNGNVVAAAAVAADQPDGERLLKLLSFQGFYESQLFIWHLLLMVVVFYVC